MIKLALGTAQFGLKYGINNTSGIPSNKELSEILETAWQAGINTLDTAQEYGNSEERIGSLSKYDFNIITKFKTLNTTLPNQELFESLNKIKTNSIFGYLSHDPDLLLRNPFWWDSLNQAKEKGLINNIGYSIYSVQQLENLLDKKFIPDIIQIPYNIFDRRFKPYFDELTSLGVKIHSRSIYLQGLLLMEPGLLNKNQSKLRKKLEELREVAFSNNRSLGELCMAFVVNNPSIDRIIVGIDNNSQLTKNIEFYKNSDLTTDIESKLGSFKIEDESLINPINWN